MKRGQKLPQQKSSASSKNMKGTTQKLSMNSLMTHPSRMFITRKRRGKGRTIKPTLSESWQENSVAPSSAGNSITLLIASAWRPIISLIIRLQRSRESGISFNPSSPQHRLHSLDQMLLVFPFPHQISIFYSSICLATPNKKQHRSWLTWLSRSIRWDGLFRALLTSMPRFP